ncbi:MAG: concanavalin A-like lectin/glucanase domain-containing protein [Benjaminiella poitrasii]|nr:MAG: concanavalin A-like lectin/glucanase domain-containing protein [Benjaminiella poitrasii]
MVSSLTIIFIIGIIVFFVISVFLLCFTSNAIQLSFGNYSEFDNWLLESEESIACLTEDARLSYERAKIWQDRHPPDSIPTDITPPQLVSIQEKGVSAFEFEGEPDANVYVAGRTELQFIDGECCIQTNLPLPRQQEVYYWEAKLFEKPDSTTVSVGVATKPYPAWRLPGTHTYSLGKGGGGNEDDYFNKKKKLLIHTGWNRYSIGYFSDNGCKYFSSPFNGKPYGVPFSRGDVIGVGYKHRTGTIFFTRNGRRLEDAYTGLRWNLFPTIGANGPCQIHVNLGQAGFVFVEANVKKWGLAPSHGTLAPPPAYGLEHDTILLASASNSMHHLQLMPSSSNRDHRHTNESDDRCSSTSRAPSSALLITVDDDPIASDPPPYSTQNSLLD